MSSEKVIVLGAGFQGICAALALKRKGHEVTLVDKSPDCMLRTSLRNEGKIHIGFVYANDPSFRTSALMLQSALVFARLIEDWLGMDIDWPSLRSRPFTYVIAQDSMLPAHQILASYEELQKTYLEMGGGGRASYLGETPERLWHEARPARFSKLISRNFATDFINTSEVALNLAEFRRIFSQMNCLA